MTSGNWQECKNQDGEVTHALECKDGIVVYYNCPNGDCSKGEGQEIPDLDCADVSENCECG